MTRAAALRKKIGLTQAQLARLANTTQPRISNLEAGTARPCRSRLVRLAALLHFEGEPESLLDPVDEVESSTGEGQQ